MAKGEYEFPILVTCLIILGLQIHNPFQKANRNGCECDCSSSPDYAGSLANTAATVAAKSAARSDAPTPPPPVSRRPKQVTPQSGSASGLSTDALLRELDSIQAKAKEQQETLAAAGRMPPSSAILEHLKETEANEDRQADSRFARNEDRQADSRFARGGSASASVGGATASGGSAGYAVGAPVVSADASALRSRDELGRFLDMHQPRGLGVILGVGRGDFALRLLSTWTTSQGLYLVDPYIHIWRGYDDPANVPDREHQVLFEELRSRLTPFEGRYVLVRDFSHSFSELYLRGDTAPGAPTFVYVDANHAEPAVSQDLESWWPLLTPGGVLAGSTYMDDSDGNIRVRAAVDRFAAQRRLQVQLTNGDPVPTWYIIKS